MKKTLFIAFIVYFIAVTFGFLLLAQRAEATQGHHHGSYPTPTNTPTIAPTPFPTINPCQVVELELKLVAEYPCPTPSQEPAPTLAPSPHGDGLHSEAPSMPKTGDVVCRAEVPQPAFNLSGKRIDSTTVHISWTKSGTGHDAQILRYGRSKDNLEYGIPSLPADSEGLDVKGIDWNTGFWFQVGTKNGDCYNWSEIMDP